MTEEALKLRADNNLEQLGERDRDSVRSIVNTSVDDARNSLVFVGKGQNARRVLEVAYDYERTHANRSTILKLISSSLRKLPMSETPAPAVTPSEILLSGSDANALSPLETAARTAVEDAIREARRLADLVKDYGRAGTAAKTLCGIHLRHVREYHFGPRNAAGGRPKMKTPNVSGFSTWGEFLADRVGITDDTATNWMKMAEAVEALAGAEGLDLQTVCQKLPWDWTPEEAAAIDATVRKLTENKTQRELLQADFLTCLGYQEPERSNGSNNPTGRNGGKKQPAASPQEKVESQRLLARTALFGHDSKDHRPKPGSPAFWMNALVEAAGKGELKKHPLASLTKKERADIYDLLIRPFLDSWKGFDA